MALRLCAGCDRHVRSQGPCPFCGSDAVSAVPSLVAGSRRAMQLGAGAVLVGTVAATGCVVMVYGAPVECDTPDCGATSTSEASAPTPDASALAPSCYRPVPADPALAAPPELGADACTDETARAVARDCARGPSPACAERVQRDERCTRCVLGSSAPDLAVDGAPPREGAILYLPTSGARVPNVAACAALVSLRADCAAELADDAVCVGPSCSACANEGRASCVREARAKACTGKARTACLEAIEVARASWEPVCLGDDDDATIAKLAVAFCVGTGKTTADASRD